MRSSLSVARLKRSVSLWNKRLLDCFDGGGLEEARQLFDEMPERDIASWTTMISGYGRHGRLQNSVDLFEEMPHRNQVAWNAMLSAYVSSDQIQSARQLFDKMPQRNSVSYSIMITGLSRGGSASDALNMFNSMPCSVRNVVCWTAMIDGLAHNGDHLGALKFFSSLHCSMWDDGVTPNGFTFTVVMKSCVELKSIAYGAQIHALIVKLYCGEGEKESGYVYNSLMNLYAKCGDLREAENIFHRLKKKDLVSLNQIMDGYIQHYSIDKGRIIFDNMKEKDVISWNIMISGLSENGHGEEALRFFVRLLQSWPYLKPSPSTYSIVITVCSTLAALEQGRQIHAQVMKVGYYGSNVFVGNSLISMYSNCGCILESEQVFGEMVHKDIVSWNALILGLGQNGCPRKALETADTVLDVANHNTFIAILTSCSHGGLVDDGLKYFALMNSRTSLEPSLDHYICVIDMLGRAGRVSEAYEMIREMPFAANAVVWRSLLSSCVAHGDLHIGKIAAQQLLSIEPDSAEIHIMLANIYDKNGRFEESRDIRKLMGERRLKKEPGCSWIRMRNHILGLVV